MNDGVNSASTPQEPPKYWTFRIICGNVMTVRHVRDKFYKAGIKVKRHGKVLMPYHKDKEYLQKVSREIGIPEDEGDGNE